MDGEQVALTPKCEECLKEWLPADEERWRAIWIDDGPETVFVRNAATSLAAASLRVTERARGDVAAARRLPVPVPPEPAGTARGSEKAVLAAAFLMGPPGLEPGTNGL